MQISDIISKMALDKSKLAYAATIFSLIGISFSAPLGTYAIKSGAAPVVVGIYRMAFSLPMMAAVWIFSYAKSQKKGLPKKEISKGHKLFNMLSGVFLAFHFICWYLALANTSVFSASALVSLQPIYAMVGTYLVFRQKPARSVALPLIIALIGSFVLILPSAQGEGAGSLFGNIMAAAAGIFMAAYLMCGKYSMEKISLGGYATVTYGVCLAVMAAAALIFRMPVSLDYKVLAICFALSISATLFGHTLINWSLPYVGAFFVTVVLLGEPVGASIVAYFMFGTVPGWMELAGGAMVIAGIAMLVVRSGRRKKIVNIEPDL